MLHISILIWALMQTPSDKQPFITMSPPATGVRAGESTPIGVYFRNDGTSPMPFVPPAAIIVKLVTPQQELELELKRSEKEAEREETIAPGASAFVQYVLTLPKDVSGRLVVQAQRFGGAPTVLDVTIGDEKTPISPDDEHKAAQSAPDAPAKFLLSEHTLSHFSGHEPMYFLGGTDRPNVRFQLSMKYRLANPEGPLASNFEFMKGLYVAYTQTSLWDIEGESSPFTDTNYKPEVLWSKDELKWAQLPGVTQVGFQAGLQHESNGRALDESRSLSLAYVRPVLYFGERDSFHWQVSPKVYTYIGDLSDNPDIADYRGYCDLRVMAGMVDGLEVSALGRLGAGGDHGSLQFDATFPLRVLGPGSFDLFLQAQYFTGYGESLRTYDEYTEAFRIGIALVR